MQYPDRSAASPDEDASTVAATSPSTLTDGEGSGSDGTLADIVERLDEALHPQRIYLFGSRARGERGEDSD